MNFINNPVRDDYQGILLFHTGHYAIFSERGVNNARMFPFDHQAIPAIRSFGQGSFQERLAIQTPLHGGLVPSLAGTTAILEYTPASEP
ncbi:MAG: hypothetical protein AAAB35_11745 [Phyllobacterium sp.]|uniref:hypothetical protein n=1 Tax=Phyllobacterium sp. TaxID=1871046 RepID=UPI0030EFC17B